MFMSHGPSINSDKRDILHSYKAADKFLADEGTSSYQFGRQAGYLERTPAGGIGVRYHSTYVYTMEQDGSTSFDTGQWHTRSTAAWMRSNPNFEVNLRENDHSTIRFRGHDRNVEQKLRDEWGMPSFAQESYIWSDTFQDWKTGAISDPILHERAQYFRTELRRRQEARHPTYIFQDGIAFTKRGRCLTNAVLLSERRAKDRIERAEIVAKRRSGRSAVRKITNKIMSALSTGIPVESETAEQLVRVTSKLPGDIRDWLNFHEREGEIVMGDLAPIVEPIIRRELTATLTRTYVPSLP